MQSSKNKINEKVHYEKNDYKTSQNELENEPYYCHYCNYQSENISNYKRHLKTKKHKQEIAKHNGQPIQERSKTPPIKEQEVQIFNVYVVVFIEIDKAYIVTERNVKYLRKIVEISLI